MKQFQSISKEVDIIGQIADLKEVDYKNMLVLTALIELLIDKGIISRKEVLQKTNLLDLEMKLDDLLQN